MKASIPQSIVVPGHPRYAQLISIRDELAKRAGGIKRLRKDIPVLLRQEIDIVIDTPRTGRRAIEDLEKTEKTYIGTRVEILVRSYFKLSKGKLDLLILGEDADVKFTTQSNWMIPREAVGRPCLLIAADEVKAKCYFGLFWADAEYLTAGANQDKKRQISAKSFENILWLFCAHPMTRNFWLTIPEAVAEEIGVQKTGNDRLVKLFSEVQQRPVSREVIAATTRQIDYMRRIRSDKGGGTRDRLAGEGILLLSGKYDQDAIELLGLGPVSNSEFVSRKVRASEISKLSNVTLPPSFKLSK